MRLVIMDELNTRVEKTWVGPPLTELMKTPGAYEKFAEHWFAEADKMASELKADGLVESEKLIRKFIRLNEPSAVVVAAPEFPAVKASIPSETEGPNEPILPDAYPMYGDYWYVIDKKVTRSGYDRVTVGEYKRITKAQEVRRCDASWRGLPVS